MIACCRNKKIVVQFQPLAGSRKKNWEVFKMKFAYKVIKNKKNKVTEESSALSLHAAVVSFILVAKVAIAFRECAQIVKIAEETGCVVEIASGSKVGTSESILSLVGLEISADKSLVLTVKGENNNEALKRISKIISGETPC